MPTLTDSQKTPFQRVEFEFQRTICSCADCSRNCLYIPGYLIPSDLLRILPADSSAIAWAKSYLRASPGALVAFQGQPFRIPTIVPARQEDGSCVFYAGGLCSIHDIAPYGCAFFDNHMGDTEANHRSGIGLSAILADGCGGYGVLWQHLWDCGLRVPGPEVSRRKMDEEGDTAPGVNQHYNKTPIELKEEAA